MKLSLTLAACASALITGILSASPATAANTYLTNPAGFAYNSVANVSQYAHPTGMIIVGRCNRYDPAFASARAAGAELLAYLDPVERPDAGQPTCQLDQDFYMGNASNVPLWPYPLTNPGQRSNYPNTKIADIRAGRAWADSVVAYVEHLMAEDKVDGVFLDVVGARLWSASADWNSWPQTEKDDYTQGTIDLVRRLDASRRANKPHFIIVNNNFWDRGDAMGFAGEQYVDGVCSEHHASTSVYHQNYLARPFGNLGHRRVIAMGIDNADAQAWATMQGVTHVTDQTSAQYNAVNPPAIPFHRLTDRPRKFGRIDIATNASAGMTANQKRGSKFSLTEAGTLLSFSAYLDGNGGASGSQSVSMVLYQDNGGVPGAKVAESSTVNVASGTAPDWVNFPAPATALSAGTYWIVLHTGNTGVIARNRGDGAANWYGNADTFSDGASNPFGAGSTGAVTLSVNVSYTLGN